MKICRSKDPRKLLSGKEKKAPAHIARVTISTFIRGTTHCVCELCGLEGTLEIVDGAFKFKYDPATEHHAHDILSGKFLHGQDIFENEGRLMNLYKDPEFKKRKEHYTAVCEPTPAPSKQK